CRRLLQLQVGRSALRRCFRSLRGSRQRTRQPARPGNRRTLLARDPRRRRQPPGAGILQGLPRPRAARRCPVATQRNGDHMIRHFLLAAALLATTPALLAQTTYRWVDERGIVHYSDQPPPAHVRNVDR